MPPNGVYKIEKGDEVMTLVPAEASGLAPMLAARRWRLRRQRVCKEMSDGGDAQQL
jgi:hypothetical protein